MEVLFSSNTPLGNQPERNRFQIYVYVDSPRLSFDSLYPDVVFNGSNKSSFVTGAPSGSQCNKETSLDGFDARFIAADDRLLLV